MPFRPKNVPGPIESAFYLGPFCQEPNHLGGSLTVPIRAHRIPSPGEEPLTPSITYRQAGGLARVVAGLACSGTPRREHP